MTVRPLPHTALGASALFEAYATGRPEAVAFYGRAPGDAGLVAAAEAAAAGPSRAHRAPVADVLAEQNAAWDAGDAVGTEAALALVDRLRDPDAVAVVTGQQLGLFAGPLYTVYKALTAVRTAVHVEALTGRPAVPVVWRADEDYEAAARLRDDIAKMKGDN